ncbi:MAG: hypothetical protein SOW59_05540 [Corynebacterium sp.]|nr:hypothetical protein [Corynebacterium sp.]
MYGLYGRQKLAVLAAVAGSLLVASCSAALPFDSESDLVLGDAAPASSPSSANSSGDIIDFSAITDLENVGDVVAARTGDSLHIGTTDELRAGNESIVKLSAPCGEMTSTADAFLVACGTSVYKVLALDPANPSLIPVDVNFPVTAATELPSGELFVASDSSTDVVMYANGKKQDTITVEEPVSELLSVENHNGKDSVIRTNREASTIQNIDWSNSRAGGRLRVGLGLGQTAVGDNGTIVVSDTTGKRLAIYTSDSVVRLHQLAPVEGSPWGVDWDSYRNLVWVTTTDNNALQGFDISTGVPELVSTIDTVAQAEHIRALPSGEIVVGSNSSDGLQILKTTDINTAQNHRPSSK